MEEAPSEPPVAARAARRASGSALRFALGYCVGLVVRFWALTYRVALLAPQGGAVLRPAVLCFWHGQQMALVAARRRVAGAVVMVSRSRDGDVQAGVMTALGFRVIRGSSSRGGAPALAASIKAVRAGGTALFAVDGPRGPRHVAKPGAAHAASAARAPLVPVASAAARRLVLGKAWDHFEIPWPFSRVAVVIGSAIGAAEAAVRSERLEGAIAECRQRAEALVTTEGATRTAAYPRSTPERTP